jgi:tetratricopeptide (TPR) repeat protein
VNFVPRIDLLTRLELFLRRADLTPLALARATEYSRQHLLRVRVGETEPTLRFVVAVTQACAELTSTEVSPELLFERGDDLVRVKQQRSSRIFQRDLQTLAGLLDDPIAAPEWVERVIAADISSETAVRHLLRHATAHIDRQPRESAAIFSAAAAMVRTLPMTPPELAASLEAHALKGRANALRHLTEFEAALQDLARASALFLQARYCTNEAGQVEYTRGTVLFKMERWPEARAAAARARTHLVATADTRRAAHADLLRAGILFDEGDVRAARDLWARLCNILIDLKDTDALARVWQNLGACDVRLGNRDGARHWLRLASAAFRNLGNRTELARTRWNIASYVTTFRDRTRGIRALQRVEQDFVDLGLFTDAACAGLEAIELMLETGSPVDALTRRAQDVAGVLVRAGLAASAAAALDQLRRIAVARDHRAVIGELRTMLRDADEPCRARPRDDGPAGLRPGRPAP